MAFAVTEVGGLHLVGDTRENELQAAAIRMFSWRVLHCEARDFPQASPEASSGQAYWL